MQARGIGMLLRVYVLGIWAELWVVTRQTRHWNLTQSVKSYHLLPTHTLLQGPYPVLPARSTSQIAWATPAWTSCTQTCWEHCVPASFPSKPLLSLHPGRAACCLQCNSQVTLQGQSKTLWCLVDRVSRCTDPLSFFPAYFLDLWEEKHYILKTISFAPLGAETLFSTVM